MGQEPARKREAALLELTGPRVGGDSGLYSHEICPAPGTKHGPPGPSTFPGTNHSFWQIECAVRALWRHRDINAQLSAWHESKKPAVPHPCHELALFEFEFGALVITWTVKLVSKPDCRFPCPSHGRRGDDRAPGPGLVGLQTTGTCQDDPPPAHGDRVVRVPGANPEARTEQSLTASRSNSSTDPHTNLIPLIRTVTVSSNSLTSLFSHSGGWR